MHPILIIAEAGVNHNGDPETAFKLVEAAAAAGADIVKFQTFQAEALVSPEAGKAAYQTRRTDADESQLDMLRRLELPPDLHRELLLRCHACGIRFLSTPFDIPSVRFLRTLGLDMLKLPSGAVTDLPYLRAVGKCGAQGVELVLSTGMSTLDEVRDALAALENAGTPRGRVTLLHCTTEYPAPYAEVNLRAMQTLRAAFPGVAGVGYSDHTMGIEIPVAAAALGARIIEKHFTLDRSMEGPDHKASLEPDELTAMVRAVRHVETALGDGVKQPTASESANMVVVRKSITAARNIRAGEAFSEDNLTTRRPGTGISPMRWDDVLGTVACRDIKQNEQL